MLKNMLTRIKNNFSVEWLIYFFLVFAALNFGNNIYVLVSLSVVANIFMLIFGKRKINQVNLLTLLLCIIPIFGCIIFCCMSSFNLDPNSNFKVVDYVFAFIGCLSVPFLGFQARISGKFNIKTAFKVFYCALAAYMAINFLITLINYGPFYTFIYSDRFLFDYGHIARLPVGKTAYMLLCFKSEVVTAEYFSLFASLLSSAILGAVFVSYKEDKRSFLTFLICGCIGLLCIILTLNKGLIVAYLALALSFALVILFGKRKITFGKTTKIVTFSIVGVISFVYLIFMLNALNIQPLAQAIESNNFLNKLFNTNRVFVKYRNIVRAMADTKVFGGFTGFLIGNDSIVLSGSWLFDMFAIGQVTGWITFIIFVVINFVRYKEYYSKSDNDKVSKILVMSVILIFLVFTLTGYNSTPYFENSLSKIIFFVTPFYIVLFLFGYTGENEEEIVI